VEEKMLKRIVMLTLVAVLGVFTAVSFGAAIVDEQDAQGYSVKLTGTSIKLVFPDGSVLSAPTNFDGKSLESLNATEGMALELLDEAYQQMGVQRGANLPKAFGLSQNFPNPFNPSTGISYTIPDVSGDITVKLNIFNIRGQLVKTLVDKTQEPGVYTVNWEGNDNQGRKVGSGVYFYRIKAGDFNSTRKMVLLK
jgi:FlgD Ig-like domain